MRVSLEDEDWKRTEQELKLYPRDRITTGTNAHAVLRFFDGTFARMDENTNVKIIESDKGEEKSEISLLLESGKLWIATPPKKIFTGSIVRTISTNWFRSDFASSAEVVVKDRSLVVFSEDGIGSTVDIIGMDQPIVIGEGQLLSLPEDMDSKSDPYAYRSALDPRAVLSAFVEGSRELFSENIVVPDTDEEPDIVDDEETPSDEEYISVSQPKDQDILQTATAEVKGNIGESVVDVQVNGYGATISEETGLFSLELALPDRNEIDITVEAIAEDGEVLETVLITVYRDLQPPNPPTIISPAKDGETYQTQQERIEIIGEAPPEAIGIIVNDYRLQFFQPGDETWKYLASTELDNYQFGENVFEAVAIKKGGLKSEPVSITVILGGDTEGVIGSPEEDIDGEEETDDTEDTMETDDEEEVPPPEEDDVSGFPNNAPLAPGTLFVRSPAPGHKYVAEGIEFNELLLEGAAPVGTKSMWVNNYKLRLFEPEKGFWNYIASTKLGTMKRGENEYVITARDKDNMIIDRVTYTIVFNPRG